MQAVIQHIVAVVGGFCFISRPLASSGRITSIAPTLSSSSSPRNTVSAERSPYFISESSILFSSSLILSDETPRRFEQSAFAAAKVPRRYQSRARKQTSQGAVFSIRHRQAPCTDRRRSCVLSSFQDRECPCRVEYLPGQYIDIDGIDAEIPADGILLDRIRNSMDVGLCTPPEE